jgi:hypothetical protein
MVGRASLFSCGLKTSPHPTLLNTEGLFSKADSSKCLEQSLLYIFGTYTRPLNFSSLLPSLSDPVFLNVLFVGKVKKLTLSLPDRVLYPKAAHTTLVADRQNIGTNYQFHGRFFTE